MKAVYRLLEREGGGRIYLKVVISSPMHSKHPKQSSRQPPTPHPTSSHLVLPIWWPDENKKKFLYQALSERGGGGGGGDVRECGFMTKEERVVLLPAKENGCPACEGDNSQGVEFVRFPYAVMATRGRGVGGGEILVCQ